MTEQMTDSEAAFIVSDLMTVLEDASDSAGENAKQLSATPEDIVRWRHACEHAIRRLTEKQS